MAVRLARSTRVEEVVVEHPPEGVLGERDTAVKDFRVVGFEDRVATGHPWMLGSFRYDSGELGGDCHRLIYILYGDGWLCLFVCFGILVLLLKLTIHYLLSAIPYHTFLTLLCLGSDRSLQTFSIPATSENGQPLPSLSSIVLAIDSNWGANYTCLYRFRVHGVKAHVAN